MSLSDKFNSVKLVSLVSGLISDMSLPLKYNYVKLVSVASGLSHKDL
jgi:hypothetical protein